MGSFFPNLSFIRRFPHFSISSGQKICSSSSFTKKSNKLTGNGVVLSMVLVDYTTQNTNKSIHIASYDSTHLWFFQKLIFDFYVITFIIPKQTGMTSFQYHWSQLHNWNQGEQWSYLILWSMLSRKTQGLSQFHSYTQCSLQIFCDE